MALKDIFTMIKADRYTADGCEEIKKAQEAIKEETADAGLPDGTMRHRKDGDYIKQAGKWVPAPAAKGKPEKGSKEDVKQRLGAYVKAMNKKNGKFAGRSKKLGESSKQRAQESLAELNRASAESKPAENTKTEFIDYERAKKAIEEGKVVQWESSDGEWHDVDPKTSTLVQARDIGTKLRVKTDAEGNPVKQKPEPSMNETRNKLLELEERRKKFEKYPDMDNKIRLEQAALLRKAGFESRAEFDDFLKSNPTDSAPRVLTGDIKIRIRKSK